MTGTTSATGMTAPVTPWVAPSPPTVRCSMEMSTKMSDEFCEECGTQLGAFEEFYCCWCEPEEYDEDE